MIDIDKVRDEYLKVCGSHDYGLHEYGCACPENPDARWALQQLCDELQEARQQVRDLTQDLERTRVFRDKLIEKVTNVSNLLHDPEHEWCCACPQDYKKIVDLLEQ